MDRRSELPRFYWDNVALSAVEVLVLALGPRVEEVLETGDALHQDVVLHLVEEDPAALAGPLRVAALDPQCGVHHAEAPDHQDVVLHRDHRGDHHLAADDAILLPPRRLHHPKTSENRTQID